MQKYLIVLSIVSTFLAGCSMDAKLISLDSQVNVPLVMPAKSTGLVSGSQQSGTAGTYHVQSSLGSYISGMKQETTSGNYTVYSSIQGSLVDND